jgi:hypothetical protein
MILFIALNLVNVVLQTIKSIVTIKNGKIIASITNATCYAFYYIIMKQLADVDMIPLILTVVGTNLIGVYVGKLIVEKFSKPQLSRIELTLKKADRIRLVEATKGLGNTIIPIDDKKDIVLYYCKTPKDKIVLMDKLNGIEYKMNEIKINS